MSRSAHEKAVVVVGHGAPAKDTPPALVRRLRTLEAERHRSHAPMSEEEAALDEQVRGWPRTLENDPYRAGIEGLVSRIRALAAPLRVEVAYNEFCAPSVPTCVGNLVAEGFRDIVLVATMMTPGGVHSEVEIPEIVATLGRTYPDVRIVHAWPFDLDAVAKLLLDQVGRFA